jgi:hypothetical protein
MLHKLYYITQQQTKVNEMYIGEQNDSAFSVTQILLHKLHS